MQRRRHLADARGVARLLHERDELFDEERVAAAAFEEQRHELGVGVAVEQRVHELAGGLLVERVELERDAVVLAGLGRPTRLDVGARGRDEHERAVAQAGEQAFAQLEGVVGGPVQVGEHEHERRLLRERFEHRQRRSQRFVAGAARVDARSRDAFEEEQQTFGDALELGGLGVGPEHAPGLLGELGLHVGLVGRRVARREPAAAPRRSGRTRSGRRRGGTRP